MDQLREDTRERTWEDYVETASAVLAVGAGAAFFLRNGGARQLSRGLSAVGTFRSSLAQQFLDHPVQSFETLESTVRHNLSSAWSNAMLAYEREPLRINPLNGDRVLSDVLSAIRTSEKGVLRDTNKNSILTSERNQIAYDTLNRIQSFAMDNAPDMALDEAQHAAIGRIGERIAASNTGISTDQLRSMVSEATQEESSYEKLLQYAEAIRDELSYNEQNISDAVNWTFRERNVESVGLDGIRFGDVLEEHAVDQNRISEAMEKVKADWGARVQAQQEGKNRFTELTDNILGRKATIGDIVERYEQSDPAAMALFNSEAAWPAVVQNAAGDRPPTEMANAFQELLEARRNMRGSDLANFDRIELDTLRIQEGQLYSTQAIRDARASLLHDVGNTLPGRLFRINDMLSAEAAPTEQFFKAASLDPSLAKALGDSGMRTGSAVWYYNGRSYAVRQNGLEEIEALRDFTIQSSRIGSQAEIFRAVSGASGRKLDKGIIDGVNISVRDVSAEYGNNFDFFLGESSVWKRLNQEMAIRTGSYGGMRGVNRVTRFLGTMDRYVSADAMDAQSYRSFNQWYTRRAQQSGGVDSTIKGILDTLEKLSGPDPEQALNEFLVNPSSIGTAQQFANPKLLRLISDYMKNPQRTIQQGIVHADQFKLQDTTAYVIEKFPDNVRKELTKELFIQMGLNPDLGADAIQDMIGATLSGERRKNMRTLAGYSLFENRIGHKVSGQTDAETAVRFLRELTNISAVGSKENELILDAFHDVRQRFNFEKEAVRAIPENEIFHNVGDYHYVHKRYSFREQSKKVLDLIKNANAYYIDKETGQRHFDPISAGRLYPHDVKQILIEAAKPVTQYFSGNDIFDAYSEVSHFGYHIMKRVNDQLSWQPKRIFGRDVSVQFALRQEHQGSAASIMANLVLRRVAPAAAILTYADWLDDATRSITGTGLAEAGASGLANSYLGIKRITGALGLDSALKSLTSDNDIVRYWSGITGEENGEWNSYEEQKDYYERGYTAIRRNRGWWFGSSNEIRGNQIAYFEPNSLRMMRSNYFMESMYGGSMWKKWSHSLLPTPTNPLSPLNYLIDPYYLENMHKEDRPYPITGSTFAENTPWGVVLNPIFDTFIKPKKQMYRDRLGSDGVDVRALIAHVNQQIRDRAQSRQNDDIIYLQNGKLRSMLFTAFNAPTPSERIIGSQGESITMSTDYGAYGSGVSGEEYQTLTDAEGRPGFASQEGYVEPADAEREASGTIVGQPVQPSGLSMPDQLVISAGKGNPIASQLVSTLKQNGVFEALRGNNARIYQKAALRKDQGLFYENKMHYETTTLDDMLANAETVSDLMTQGKGSDYIHEMAVATRNVTGLYGYLASVAFGFGENNQKRIATSQNMESFSRQFWDLSIGGVDVPESDIMEIARRFIPNYQRQAMVNPLMNTMPDWLPEKFRFGDPFAQLMRGEARLPGKGYESLNQLHPDIYGKYGSFDRFKILADIAPYSPEYKFWKKVVGATIKDPQLKQEIQEIKDRVAEQTKGHDFYHYRYLGRGMNQQTATISEILGGGKFKVDGSEQIYKLSGISVRAGRDGASTKEVMERYMYVGQEVVLATDENINYARNNDTYNTINAGVVVNGESVSEQMLEAGDAKKRKGDTSAPSYMLKHGNVVNGLNTLAEWIGHADIPVFHSRWLKLETPLESYRDDNVYGTSYQSWSDVYRSFIKPNMQKFASSPTWVGIGIAAEIINNNILDRGYQKNVIRPLIEAALGRELNPGSAVKWVSNKASYILNRGQLTGWLAGRLLSLGSSNALTLTERYARPLGSMVALGWAAAANPDNLAVSTMSWSRLGWKAAELIEDKVKYKASAIGAAIGVARWAFAQKALASDDNANTYIPDDTKKRWDMQEYFDRLTYIKYMGLYEQAADKALSEEGVNVRAIIAQQDKERAERREMKDKLHEDLRALEGLNDPESQEAKKLIRRKLREGANKIALRGGEYTKSAIMYKNAADATMYGLQDDAVMADIVRALPKTERDYFIEFMKERDPEKRQEILATVSPLLNRALRTIWKMPLPEKVSNEEYFAHHTLPAPTWAGWRPNIDLANVEAKVIYNQGMQFSDMGIYSSQYRKPEVQQAPNIEYNTSQNSTLLTKLKLQMAITGTGIDADEVSVEPAPDSGIKVIANVARIIPYKIGYEIDNFFSKI